MYRPVVPVYTRFLDWSILRNSEGHMESVQPIKYMICILICNNIEMNLSETAWQLKNN